MSDVVSLRTALGQAQMNLAEVERKKQAGLYASPDAASEAYRKAIQFLANAENALSAALQE